MAYKWVLKNDFWGIFLLFRYKYLMIYCRHLTHNITNISWYHHDLAAALVLIYCWMLKCWMSRDHLSFCYFISCGSTFWRYIMNTTFEFFWLMVASFGTSVLFSSNDSGVQPWRVLPSAGGSRRPRQGGTADEGRHPSIHHQPVGADQRPTRR